MARLRLFLALLCAMHGILPQRQQTGVQDSQNGALASLAVLQRRLPDLGGVPEGFEVLDYKTGR